MKKDMGINLIRERIILPEKKKKNFLRFLFFYLSLFTFSLLVLLLGYVGNNRVMNIYIKRIEKDEAVHKKVEKMRFSFSEEEKRVVDELKTINEIERGHFYWSPKLTSLAEFLPSDLWLSSLSFGQNGLVLEGKGELNSKTPIAVGIFLERLNGKWKESPKEMELEKIEKERDFFFFRIKEKKRIDDT